MAKWKARSPSFGPWEFTVRNEEGEIIALLEHSRKMGSGRIHWRGQQLAVRQDKSQYLITEWFLGPPDEPLWTVTKTDALHHHYRLQKGKIRLNLQKESAFGNTFNISAGSGGKVVGLGQIKPGSNARRATLVAREIPGYAELPLLFSLWLTTMIWKKRHTDYWVGIMATAFSGLILILFRYCL